MFPISPILALGWCSTLSTLSCAAACVGLFVWCITRGSKERIRAAFYEKLTHILCTHLKERSELTEEELQQRVRQMLQSKRADEQLDGLRRMQMQLVYTGQGVYTLRLILTKQTEETTLETDGINWSDLPAEIRSRELRNPQDVQSFDLAL